MSTTHNSLLFLTPTPSRSHNALVTARGLKRLKSAPRLRNGETSLWEFGFDTRHQEDTDLGHQKPPRYRRKAEALIQACGQLRRRPASAENSRLPSGGDGRGASHGTLLPVQQDVPLAPLAPPLLTSPSVFASSRHRLSVALGHGRETPISGHDGGSVGLQRPDINLASVPAAPAAANVVTDERDALIAKLLQRREPARFLDLDDLDPILQATTVSLCSSCPILPPDVHTIPSPGMHCHPLLLLAALTSRPARGQRRDLHRQTRGLHPCARRPLDTVPPWSLPGTRQCRHRRPNDTCCPTSGPRNQPQQTYLWPLTVRDSGGGRTPTLFCVVGPTSVSSAAPSDIAFGWSRS